MIQKDKELLLKDLCARLPYKVKVQTPVMNDEITLTCGDISAYFFNPNNKVFLKPYLRPLSSMTEEEKQILELCNAFVELRSIELKVDFYNQHHLDYRGLIEKGLAIEAPEDMY